MNAAEIKTEKPKTNQTMNLTSKTPLQAKTCLLVVASIALSWSAAAFEAAIVARAIEATTSRQVFACSGVLEVRFIV